MTDTAKNERMSQKEITTLLKRTRKKKQKTIRIQQKTEQSASTDHAPDSASTYTNYDRSHDNYISASKHLFIIIYARPVRDE